MIDRVVFQPVEQFADVRHFDRTRPSSATSVAAAAEEVERVVDVRQHVVGDHRPRRPCVARTSLRQPRCEELVDRLDAGRLRRAARLRAGSIRACARRAPETSQQAAVVAGDLDDQIARRQAEQLDERPAYSRLCAAIVVDVPVT